MRLAPLVAFVPDVALASDFSGVMTFMVGLPMLVVADLVGAGLLFVAPHSRWVSWVTGLVLLPVFAGGLVLSTDAITLFDGPADEARIGVAYFALLATLGALAFRLLTRPQPTA